MIKWKNAHSPSGVGGYSTHGVRLASLKDCPACKYGTLDKVADSKMRCADCGKEFKVDEKNNVISTEPTATTDSPPALPTDGKGTGD